MYLRWHHASPAARRALGLRGSPGSRMPAGPPLLSVCASRRLTSAFSCERPKWDDVAREGARPRVRRSSAVTRCKVAPLSADCDPPEPCGEGYLLGSYCIATAPEPNSSRLTSFKSIRFDIPANNVGP